MVRLLWTKNNKVGSYLIRWGTEGDCSHFAVEFDSCIILQSTVRTGVIVTSSKEFMKHNQIVHEITLDVELAEEEALWQLMISDMVGIKYDVTAMAYWSLCVLKHRIFGSKIPLENKWGDPHKFMCIEIASGLPEFVFGYDKPAILDLVSPEALFHMIDERTKDADIRRH